MIHYLPEVHDYFKFYPTKRLLVEEQAFLINKVGGMNFEDIDEYSPQVLAVQNPQTSTEQADTMTIGFGGYGITAQ